ncbi:DUF6891 domain-containing protein [Gimesia chilikensis]|uniref:DUF6891 domain-containing protein n=1 Tax=Gimesia chilikensis TaxID=2605989 RepID=UPI0018E07C52|nr:hypothetical protein [Gimesia chilikensis]
MMNHHWKTLLLLTCLPVGCGENANTKVPPQATVEPTQPAPAEPSAHEPSTLLDQSVLGEIDWLVRAGFYDKADLMRIICDEIYYDSNLDADQVSAAIDKRIKAWMQTQKTWPKVTDCDKLDQVFAKLNERGIIALQNAGNTQSDGYEIFEETLKEHPQPTSVIGYCFYHNQDLERVVDGDDLYLAFGPVKAEDEESRGPEIGKIIRQELEQAGLKVKWDGTFNERIRVTDMAWQKRNPACKPIDFDI